MRPKKRFVYDKIRCERCNKVLNGNYGMLLEYSNTDGRFYEYGKFPEGHESLGFYSFGKDCAKIVIKNGGFLN